MTYLFSEIAKVIRKGKNNRKSNLITKALAKEQEKQDAEKAFPLGAKKSTIFLIGG